jgi:hypothetical protein
MTKKSLEKPCTFAFENTLAGYSVYLEENFKSTDKEDDRTVDGKS